MSVRRKRPKGIPVVGPVQRESCRYGSRVEREIVNHVEQPEAGQLIVHDVHRPDLIDGVRDRERFRCLPDQPLARLDPQVQFQLAIDPDSSRGQYQDYSLHPRVQRA